MPKLLALTAWAVWCCQQNQAEIGRNLWAEAQQAKLVAQSVWFQTVAPQHQPQLQSLPRLASKAQENKVDFAKCMGLIRPLLS